MSSAADDVLRRMRVIRCKRGISEAQRRMAIAKNEQVFLLYRGDLEELQAFLVELETT